MQARNSVLGIAVLAGETAAHVNVAAAVVGRRYVDDQGVTEARRWAETGIVGTVAVGSRNSAPGIFPIKREAAARVNIAAAVRGECPRFRGQTLNSIYWLAVPFA